MTSYQPALVANDASTLTAARADSDSLGEHKHVPALDGIRGLAILLVLFFHFAIVGGNSPALRLIQKTWGFGWAGVDLFFVLSGFLITGILLQARGKPDYFKNFYARRTLRIFPLYFAFLLVFMVILPRVVPNFIAHYGDPHLEWSYWLYVYNLFQPHHGPKFSHCMGVTWSLCIEEQFYMVWPAVVLLVSPRNLLKVCAGLIGMSIIARLIAVWMNAPSYVTGQWTFCRMDALAVGAAVAVWMRTSDLKRFAKLSIALLIVVPIGVLVLNQRGKLVDDAIFRVFGYTALAMMFGAVLILTVIGSPKSWLVRFFSNGFLRMLGKYSYAIYLFNQPIRYTLSDFIYNPDVDSPIFGSRVLGQIVFLLIGGSISLGLAWLSWNLFEKHFLKLKRYFPMQKKIREQVENQREGGTASMSDTKKTKVVNRLLVGASTLLIGTMLFFTARELMPPKSIDQRSVNTPAGTENAVTDDSQASL